MCCYFLSILDVPIFVSKPHFLDADNFYMKKVSGLRVANRSKHDSYLWVEPVSVSNI